MSRQFNRTQNANGRQYTEDFFLYTVGPFNLAASTTSNQSINIQADADFEWMYSTAFAFVASMTFVTPIIDNGIIPLTVLITDGGSGRNLFNAAVPLGSLAGIGREPYVMPVTRIFMAKSTINFFFTNLDTVNQWNGIQLTLHGRKIFEI